MSNKTNATSLEALRAHSQAAKELGKLRRSGASEHELYAAEDTLRKWYVIYTDPQGKGASYIRQAK